MIIKSYIDYTLLKPTATEQDIISLCETALKNNYYSVCVNPCFVALAKKCLYQTNVKVVSVVGFPLGANTLETKLFEAKDAIENGADEIDFVINQGKLQQGDIQYIVNEIKEIKNVCGDKILKVIIETCNLNTTLLTLICKACILSGADFIKTSTGFGAFGAKLQDIEKIKELCGNKILIKASGGIKTKEQAENFIKAGATRIGTSTEI